MSAEYYTEQLKDYSFRMCACPAGRFLMGDADLSGFSKYTPAHPVYLDTFLIGEYPVTQALWKVVMGQAASVYTLDSQRPVVQTSWCTIVNDFLPNLNMFTAIQRPKGLVYRLPTEAEWEYAARAGEGHVFAGSDKLKQVGWFDVNSHSETKSVGLKQPNAWGLYDMSGNVYEWCHDWSSIAYYQECYDKGEVQNPSGPSASLRRGLRAVRGGSFRNFWTSCRVAFRNSRHPHPKYSLGNDNIGFRVVLAPSIAELASSAAEME